MGREVGELADLVRRGFRFALSLTHSHARADDLVQEAWLAVLSARGPWTREYLFAAIRSRFYDELRRAGRCFIESLDCSDASALEIVDGNGLNGRPFDVTLAEMESVLAPLGPEERAALYLTAVEDWTAQQVAEFLDRPRGTVLSWLHRGRRKIFEAAQGRPGART